MDAPRTSPAAAVRRALTEPPGEPGAHVLVPTSGSTGAPRTVRIAGAALRASGEATAVRLGGHGRWLLALPTTHVAGLQVLARSFLAGTEPVVLDPAAPFRPAGFAAATAELASATADGLPLYTSLVPTQLHRLLAAAGAGLDAARRFDAVLVGGAATSPALLSAARAAGIAVVTTYGMSETAGGCVYDGVPLDGVGLRVLDGRIEISGPVLADGYVDDRAATTASFRTDDDGSRWFRTSDVGQLTDAGPGVVLEVLGRADDLLITGGVNVVPAAVEALLAGWGGLGEVCVVGLPDDEWGTRVVAVVTLADHDADASRAAADLLPRVRDRVAGALGAPAAPRAVVVVDALPVRGPGKPDRRAVVALAERRLGRGSGATR